MSNVLMQANYLSLVCKVCENNKTLLAEDKLELYFIILSNLGYFKANKKAVVKPNIVFSSDFNIALRYAVENNIISIDNNNTYLSIKCSVNDKEAEHVITKLPQTNLFRLNRYCRASNTLDRNISKRMLKWFDCETRLLCTLRVFLRTRFKCHI